jgi:aminoglycoside/choline kinase family phosphotransferase
MIPLNQETAKEFLAENGIENCQIKMVAGDASFRSYYRVISKAQPHILMFAPPSHEDIKPFEKIDQFLVSHEFSAPKIYARDEKNGFLLLEDLGDDTYGRVLAKDNTTELAIYREACDVLYELHKLPAPKDLPSYNHALLFREVMLLVDWYLKLKNKVMSKAEIAEFKFLWFQLFDLLAKENQVLVLRDYHADNLMILKNREGFKSVGLLDFQDAVIGSRAYDLVSLLEDARRDVDENHRQRLLEYYLDKASVDPKSFMQDYEILSLQRNIKIIGIFARLSIRDGKHGYLNMIPRVLGHIQNRLDSDSKIFSEIKILLRKFL